MNEYEREAQRMELEDKRQARIDALPGRLKLLRWLGIWGLPLAAGSAIFLAFAIPLLWWVLN